MAEAILAAPNVNQEDFANFHAAHFSSKSVSHFAEQFLVPVEEEEYGYSAEDDNLGYYKDGVKRTLTDEQIAIFRHSEIEALLRDRRHAAEAKSAGYESSVATPAGAEGIVGKEEVPAGALPEDEELEDGELEDDNSNSQVSTPRPSQQQNSKKNKRKKKTGKKEKRPPQPKGFFRQNVKPDLRKRTWDVVEAGLGNLDYDEERGGHSTPAHAAQRRRITYDDD